MYSLYGGIDPREIHIYSIADTARYLRIPTRTVRSWTLGKVYQVVDRTKSIESVIKIPKETPPLLSFINLVEVHVLRVMRQHYQIQLDKIRIAVNYLEKQLEVSHPLARNIFYTDGVDLFVEHYGQLINASMSEKIDLENAVKERLQRINLERIEFDDTGLAITLYPYTRYYEHEKNSPRSVMIDPRISFGRPVIAETGIPTDILAERYQAGESIDELAYDYNCDRLTIEEAIRCEMSSFA